MSDREGPAAPGRLRGAHPPCPAAPVGGGSQVDCVLAGRLLGEAVIEHGLIVGP